MLNIQVAPFDTLNAATLYQILALRAEVFVVEQTCPYQDVDGLDSKAMHIMFYEEELLVAYARVFPLGVKYPDAVAISRVVVSPSRRGLSLGKQLVQKSIEVCKSLYGAALIRISAQLYLERFYTELGFTKCSDRYLEDDIPHIEMYLQLQSSSRL